MSKENLNFGSWSIIGNAIEWVHPNRGDQGYYIVSDGLLEKEGDLYSWPLHLSRKTWISENDLKDFNRSFIELARLYGVSIDKKILDVTGNIWNNSF